MVSARRPPSRATVRDAALALRRLLDVIQAGELDASTPRDVALLRRLQGTLAGWDEALGKGFQGDHHGERPFTKGSEYGKRPSGRPWSAAGPGPLTKTSCSLGDLIRRTAACHRGRTPASMPEWTSMSCSASSATPTSRRQQGTTVVASRRRRRPPSRCTSHSLGLPTHRWVDGVAADVQPVLWSHLSGFKTLALQEGSCALL